MKQYFVSIVLYQPKTEYFAHYEPLFSAFSKVLFLDNSTKPNAELVQKITSFSNAEYVNLGGNKGIALALKKACEIAISEGADYLLTLDQDSVFPMQRLSEIKNIVEANHDYGIVGLNFNSKETSLELVDVRWWLTSGNFINLKKYQTLKTGFDERLFIDAVDTDIGWKFHQAGYKVGYIKGISLIHTMGNPKHIGFGTLSFTLLNYPPIRYYYIFRNVNYLYQQDPEFFRSDKKKIDRRTKPKVLLFEKNKRKKRLAMRLGAQDGKQGKLGENQHKEIL